MKLPKISQSLIKTYVDYCNGKECGLFFKARYIDKDPEATTITSEAMKIGIYFEYLCTGGLPRSGEIPLPEVDKNGKLKAPYERAKQSALMFKEIIKHYGIKIKKIGLYLEKDNMNGIIDVYAEWDKRDVFIDIKYSGLIDDKWSDIGWETESLYTKDSLMIQGVHYKILAEKCLNIEDIPFYYFVFSTADVNNIKIILQEVDESKKQSHIVAIETVSEKLEKDMHYGFKAYPSLLKCSKCSIAHKCNSKVIFPPIDIVYY